MTTLEKTTPAADEEAKRNLERNLQALSRTQPQLGAWIVEQHLDVEWVYARDGTLTALDAAGQWWAGCSLPRRAADVIFAKLEAKGAVACFLAPAHAGQIASVLRRMRPEQAVVAVVPELSDLACMCGCEDFSDAIGSHRLWFAAGPAWDVNLPRLFEDQPGLATPASFIRVPDAAAEVIDPMIATCQRAFVEINSIRGEVMRKIQPSANISERMKVCVVAPSRFRLWNDIGGAMLDVFQDQDQPEVLHFNADDPLCSSPLALVKAASQCNVIFTANTARSDLPGLVPPSVRWITWLTTPRIPSRALAEDGDELIVVDPAMRAVAIKSGWPESALLVGGWPQAPAASPCKGPIAIVVDTVPLETPEDLTEFSSHSLLWEAIRHELARDPLILSDVPRYLDDRMRQLGVGEDSFQRARFVEKLILPAYAQGLARLLMQNKLPLRLHGQGWNGIEEFRAVADGPVESRQKLQEILSSSAAAVNVWPQVKGHPIEASGAALIRPVARNPQRLIADAKLALRGQLARSNNDAPKLRVDVFTKKPRPMAAA